MPEDTTQQSTPPAETHGVPESGDMGIDVPLSNDVLDKIATAPQEESAVETKKEPEKDNLEKEDTEALKSTPFKTREKLEDSFINLWATAKPEENMELDLSNMSTKEIVDEYKKVQREWGKSKQQPKEDIPQQTDKPNKDEIDINNPLANKKVQKAYNNLITSAVKKGLSYEKAKDKADKIINDYQKEIERDTVISEFKQKQEAEKTIGLKMRARDNIKKYEADQRFKDISAKDILKELDKRAKAQGLTEMDVVKIATAVNTNGELAQLDQLYRDAYNSLKLQNNPKLIDAIKQQGAIEAEEKIRGGAIPVSPQPDIQTGSKKAGDGKDMYDMQEGFRRA